MIPPNAARAGSSNASPRCCRTLRSARTSSAEAEKADSRVSRNSPCEPLNVVVRDTRKDPCVSRKDPSPKELLASLGFLVGESGFTPLFEGKIDGIGINQFW